MHAVSFPMVVNEAGALLVGIVFGWTLDHTAMQSGWDWKSYIGVLAAVVGGAGIDFLFKTDNVGYFWIGIFIGFAGNVAYRMATKREAAIQVK